ncbi:interferon-inducible GTPase 5-like [Paramuricea clavata]|uniref:Interferon-inducible GTPase 5-like n=1 Tax=Paramuricea clavata TaxID=317549 RepID=A0A6S7K7A0_PARCT|nr:interferon-inducible GTPase 5-like [Paramuricea clavata]
MAAAQDMTSHALHAFTVTVGVAGGDLSFTITTDNVKVAKELCDTAVEITKELCDTAVEITKELSGTAVEITKELGDTAATLGTIYVFYKLAIPVVDAVIDKVFDGERDDQEVREIRPGSLHVLLRCFTDKRFLEVLADYESGRIKERLQKEFSLVGIEVEGLKVEIENMEEVEKIKAAINKRKSKRTTASTPSQRNRLAADLEHGLRLMDTAGDTKAKVEHGDFDYPKFLPTIVKILQFIENSTGVSKSEEFIKTKLESWKNVEINIGVTGGSGVGKSSFINAIRRLADDDDGAAETGVTEKIRVATVYPHPTNDKIKFWDLPSIGTANYPDFEIYCKQVGLVKCDIFLILTARRFTANDLLLAKKVNSMKKSFFLVRTNIDQDVHNRRRKETSNEKAILNDIRKDCLENLESFGASDGVVFLISNHYPAKWDFARLTQAILDVLPADQKQSLTLSLDVSTSNSKDILKRKVEVLRGNYKEMSTFLQVTICQKQFKPHSMTFKVNIARN